MGVGCKAARPRSVTPNYTYADAVYVAATLLKDTVGAHTTILAGKRGVSQRKKVDGFIVSVCSAREREAGNCPVGVHAFVFFSSHLHGTKSLSPRLDHRSDSMP